MKGLVFSKELSHSGTEKRERYVDQMFSELSIKARLYIN